MPWLAALLTQLLGSAVARVATGAGIGLVTFAALTPIVLSAMNEISARMGGIESAVLNIMLLSGAGPALSMIGSAIVARVAIEAGKIGLKKVAS